METFIANLRKAIAASGLSQRELCDRAGIFPSNLSRLLTKADNITLAIASDISDAAGYPLHRMLDPKFKPRKTVRQCVSA